jgi:hypothetical protein
MAVQLRQELLQGWLAEALKKEGGRVQVKRRLGRRELGAAGALLGAGGGELEATVGFKRVGVSLSPRGCGQPLCVALELETSLKLSGQAGKKRLFSVSSPLRASGVAPLRLENRAGRASLRLDLAGVELGDLELPSKQIPRALRSRVQGLLAQGVQGLLRRAGSRVTLATWEPWRLEGSQVKLQAASLRQSAPGVLEVGFASNLPLAGRPALAQAAVLGKGEQVAVRFSQGALLELTRLWMQRPGAPSRLDEDFKPDPQGIHRVTLESIAATREGLQLEVTLWRIGRQEEETCYAARARGDAMFHVKRGGRVRLKLEDLTLIKSQGEDTLLRLGAWARSLFFSQGLAAQANVLAVRSLKLGPLGEQTWAVRRVQGEEGAVTVVVGPRE